MGARRLAYAAAALLLACPVSEDGSGSTGPDVTQTVGPQGGTVRHSSGVELRFVAGALPASAPVTIRAVPLPQPLPAGIAAGATAFDITAPGATLSFPPELTLPLSSAQQKEPKGKLSAYRWDGITWSAAGGVVEGGKLVVHLSKFSVWVIGTGSALHKPFEFLNQGSETGIIFPFRFALGHPELDAPIDTTIGTPVQVTEVPAPVQFYPQGGICFCVQWWNVSHDSQVPSGWRHAQVGSCIPPQNQWTYSSSEMSSDIVPESVIFHTGPATLGEQEGPCGVGGIVGGGAGAGAGGSADGGTGGGPPVSLAGTWSMSIRCVGQTTAAMTITFVITQAGGSFSASGSGADYDGTPITGQLQGSVDANNVISGTLSISVRGTLVRIDSFSAPLVADTGWVPLTVVSHTGYEQCTAEARFVKQ